MIVYSKTKYDFVRDVLSNEIDRAIEEAVKERLGHATSPSEVTSWRNSMQYMSNALNDPDIPDDAGVAIEYRIPQTAKRIDFILSGQDGEGRRNAVIVELKQWSEAWPTEKDGIVETFLGSSIREVAHPSYQAWTYACLLQDYNEVVYQGNIQLSPCAYLHNCTVGAGLLDSRYSNYLSQAPIFLRQDAEKLSAFIKRYVRRGDRGELLYEIDHGRIRPSKNLADHLSSLLQGNPEFRMIDEQKIVYETALKMMRNAEEGKQVLVVHGGPGTGKTVVAMNLLVHMTQAEKVVRYVTRNSAPREVYEAKLAGTMRKSRITNLFSSSGVYTESEVDAFDALLVDEAHRLNEKSGIFQNLGENQVGELIRAARLTLFFLDENQRVTWRDIGSRDEILKWARRNRASVQELTLSSQFRCNGSDGYLAWLDHTLQIRETANETLEGLDYDFRVCETPNELKQLIGERNLSSQRARMVAGYCWDWKSKKDKSKMDIVFPEHGFQMQWNLSEDGMQWILKPESIEQIGCIHTCQGLELDYVGVIFGNDFVIRDGVAITDAAKRSRMDKSVQGYKGMLKKQPIEAKRIADLIIKNTYRTLMTRGQKGCFVYSSDPETREWFKGRSRRSPRTVLPWRFSNEVQRKFAAHPFTIVAPEQRASKPHAVPLFDILLSAGQFIEGDVAEDCQWVELPETFRWQPGLFIARVRGDSMNKKIPDGSWCLFKANPAGTRQGKVILARHHSIRDLDDGGRYTVKIYRRSEGEDPSDAGAISLVPCSDNPVHVPINFTAQEATELSILAEWLAVIG